MEEETRFTVYNRETGFPVEQYIAEDYFAPTCCLVIQQEVVNDASTDHTKRVLNRIGDPRVTCFQHEHN